MKLPSLLSFLACAAVLQAADWPQWRGPMRSGSVLDPQHPLAALNSEPKQVWQINAGEGYASPVTAGPRLIYLDAQGGNETAHCVELATGRPVWTETMAPLVEFTNFGPGPRCTPLIDGDRVYLQSASGEFQCRGLADGKLRWHTNFETVYGAKWLGNKSNDPDAKETASRRHGNNGSAAVDGNSIFVPVGSPNGATLVAFDKLTGKELWRAGNDNTAYASVMVATLAGARQVVHFTADALMGVDVATGKVLWRNPLKTGAKRHVCTPVIAGDTVTVASTSIGTQQFRVVKNGSDFTAPQVWANARVKTNLATPVQLGRYLYTLGSGDRTSLVCLEAETGKQLWEQPGFGEYASLTIVNDKLLVLNATGELLMCKASPEKYEELGRAQVCGKTFSSPAYANGIAYVKDDAHVSALQLAP